MDNENPNEPRCALCDRPILDCVCPSKNAESLPPLMSLPPSPLAGLSVDEVANLIIDKLTAGNPEVLDFIGDPDSCDEGLPEPIAMHHPDNPGRTGLPLGEAGMSHEHTRELWALFDHPSSRLVESREQLLGSSLPRALAHWTRVLCDPDICECEARHAVDKIRELVHQRGLLGHGPCEKDK